MIHLPPANRQLFVFIFLFSSIIGAYCTTADYRIRKDLPLITKDCFCPSCGHRLPAIHQIPIMSWLLLRGRCRYCNTAIPARYPLIEAGFIFFYCTVFLLFQSHPLVYILLWYFFFSIFLLVRSHGHWRGFLKGLCILSIYHIVFTSMLMLILASLSVPLF